MPNLDVSDRRRLLVATAVTLIALPAMWLFTRDEASTGSPPGIAAAGVDTPQAAGDTTATTQVDPFGSTGPIFIDGPSTPPKPEVIQIMVPADVDGDYIEGGATYQRVIGNALDNCSATNAPFGATLKVTNRDNGRSVSCVNRLPQVLPDGLAITLTTAQFEEIAQLVDSPVPVRITWNGTG